MADLKAHREQAALTKKRLHKFLDRLKSNPPRDLDEQVMEADAAVFSHTDCLDCANCCKTISPIFISKDIDRIAGHLGMKAGTFTEHYLRVDEDGDWVLKSSPCPFLLPDNRCKIYDVRPRACAGYPHTAQRKFHLNIGITKQNLAVCPAAHEIVLRLESIYKQA